MTIQQMAHRLLDELSVDNLRSGKLTRQAMAIAVLIARKNPNFCVTDLGLNECIATHSDRILSEVLNEMFNYANNIRFIVG